MKHITKLAAFGICSALFACTGQIIDERDNASGTDQGLKPGSGQGQGGSGPDGADSKPAHPAIALTRAQFSAAISESNKNGSSSYSTGTGGGGLDPNDLFIRISNEGQSCEQPIASLSCGNRFRLSVALPPAYQAIGIYDLDDPTIGIYSMLSETGPVGTAADDCWFGAGSVGPGTIEVTRITDSEIDVVVKLEDNFYESNPSGKYTAIRCQP